MKKTLLLKRFFITLLICFSTSVLFGETDNEQSEKDSDYQFSINASAGMLYGTSFELVYRTSSALLSELRWDMKPLFYWGSSVEFSRRDPASKPGFYAELGIKTGIPANTGFIEDRDWDLIFGELTHFSKHDNITNSALLFDASLGFSIPVFSTGIVVTPLLGFHYMHYQWTAQDGYTQYAKDNNANVWDESLPKTPSYGSVVGYSQDWIIGSFGMSVQYSFLERFTVEGRFLFSPLILVYAKDNHYQRENYGGLGIRFYDEVSQGYMLEPALSLTFSFTRNIKLNLKTSYRYIDNSKGDAYAYNNTGNHLISISLAGAEYQVWDAGITFTYCF